jgi:hypothetical protein
VRGFNGTYQIFLALDASLSKQKSVAKLSVQNVTTYLPYLKCSLKGEKKFSTVYECVKEQITTEFIELKCFVYLVNSDDERELE